MKCLFDLAADGRKGDRLWSSFEKVNLTRFD